MFSTALHPLTQHHRDLVHHHHTDLGPLGRSLCRGWGSRGWCVRGGAVRGGAVRGGAVRSRRTKEVQYSTSIACPVSHSLSNENGMVHRASFLMMSFCKLGTYCKDNRRAQNTSALVAVCSVSG